MIVYKGRLPKKNLKSKVEDRPVNPVNIGLFLAFKHRISFATDFKRAVMWHCGCKILL